MNSRKMFALSSGLLLGVAGVVSADTTASDADLKATVDALKARVSELEGKQSQNWLNEQRAEEVKGLVRDVLADADTRTSLMANGMTAGHNGKFFLASEDNNFLLNVGGLLQVRYNYDHRREPANVNGNNFNNSLSGDNNESTSGFEVHRGQIQFDGHIVSPEWTYVLRLEADSVDNSVGLQRAAIAYQVTDMINVKVGRDKAGFLKEDMIDDGFQEAVDRSVISALFGMGYIEGVTVTADATDFLKVSIGVNDGSHSGDNGFFNGGVNHSYYADGNDLNALLRVDAKIMGDWKQANDFAAWSGQETALFVGGGFDYGVSETGQNNVAADNNKGWAYTADAQFKTGGLNVYGAFVGAHSQPDTATNNNFNFNNNNHKRDTFGLVAQAGYMVIPDKLEPFARYEYYDLDGINDGVQGDATTQGRSNHNHIITGGVNYYIAKHQAKVTLDTVYLVKGLTTGASPTGNGLLVDNTHGDQVLVRAQVQLMF